MRISRTSKIASFLVMALALAGCSDQDPVEAETLIETLVEVGDVERSQAECAAGIIFGPGSGFTEEEIRNAEEDLASVAGFEDFATDALRECGAIQGVEGPVLDP